MKLLFRLAELLESEGYGSIGTNIYINNVPFEITEAIMVRPPMNGFKIDQELPGYFKSTFCVVLRSAGDVGLLEDKALEISTSLAMRERDIGTEFHVNYMRPLQLPYTYPITKGELVECKVDFEFSVVIK
jgi:Bacteriophage minor capsid protein